MWMRYGPMTGNRIWKVTCSKLICQAQGRADFEVEGRLHRAGHLDGCGGSWRKLTSAASLADLDWSKVNGGDVLAVKRRACVAYLGEGQCMIQIRCKAEWRKSA